MKSLSLVSAFGAVALVTFGSACGDPKKPAEAPAAPATVTPPTTTSAAPGKSEKMAVNVDDDIIKACNLKFENIEDAPKFDYDTSELAPADRDVLQQIAVCVTSGPLKGKKLELTGRADPRGTEEYNLGLGTRRADSVATFLQRLGVQQAQLGATTRGALDAAGTSESSWTTDRRVDITLGT